MQRTRATMIVGILVGLMLNPSAYARTQRRLDAKCGTAVINGLKEYTRDSEQSMVSIQIYMDEIREKISTWHEAYVAWEGQSWNVPADQFIDLKETEEEMETVNKDIEDNVNSLKARGVALVQALENCVN